MDVILGVRGHVEVEDVADGRDIQTASCHVRGDQQAQGAITEFVQRLGADGLVKVAVDRGCVKAVGFQGLGHHIHIHLAVAEDDSVGQSLAFAGDQRAQDGTLFGEGAVFAGGCEGEQLLLDRHIGGCLTRDFNLRRIIQEGVGDPFNFRGHGRTEEQGLAGFRRHLEDTLDVRDEAHVEHAVSLIDHHDLHAGQQQFATLEMIKQSARGSNQHVNTAVDQLVLIAEGNAADQQSLGQLGVFGIFVKAFGHLSGEFPRGGQHQRTRHPGTGAALAEQCDHRQREACRFAGAGLGNAQNVLAAQGGGNGLLLNGGRGFVTGFNHRLQYAGVQL